MNTTPEILARETDFTHPAGKGLIPDPRRSYEAEFKPDRDYIDSLPDLTDSTYQAEGADVDIQQVGVSGFCLPLQVRTRDSKTATVEARVTASVSLDQGKKGINMSRLIRSFYPFQDQVFDVHLLDEILQKYLQDLDSRAARVRLQFRLPEEVPSLRSGLKGYQYYDVSLKGKLREGQTARLEIELDFVYSSTCPCSAELSEHAREVRGTYAVPHSQRSKARLKVALKPGAEFAVTDLVDHARRALKTETQVMVKREDEQAFAEMNGANLKFVEGRRPSGLRATRRRPPNRRLSSRLLAPGVTSQPRRCLRDLQRNTGRVLGRL